VGIFLFLYKIVLRCVCELGKKVRKVSPRTGGIILDVTFQLCTHKCAQRDQCEKCVIGVMLRAQLRVRAVAGFGHEG
jgi:hypothetical protein